MHITKLKLTRLKAGKRQWEIASSAGISESYLSKLETGRTVPPEEIILKLAKALGVTTEALNEDANHTVVEGQIHA